MNKWTKSDIRNKYYAYMYTTEKRRAQRPWIDGSRTCRSIIFTV